MAFCANPGNLLNQFKSAELLASQAARYCKPISMEVNERVITVLCSSQGSSGRVAVAVCSSG